MFRWENGLFFGKVPPFEGFASPSFKRSAQALGKRIFLWAGRVLGVPASYGGAGKSGAVCDVVRAFGWNSKENA